MDIRKFFEPRTALKKPTEATKSKDETPKNKDVTPKNKDSSPRTNKVTPSNSDSRKNNKKPVADSAGKKKTSLTPTSRSKPAVADSAGKKETSSTPTSRKKTAVADEAAVIIDDSSGEEVVTNSRSSSKGGRNSGNSVGKTEVKCKTDKVDEEVSSITPQPTGLSNGKKRGQNKTGQGQGKDRTEDDIDIESVKSTSSSVSGSVSSQGKKTSQKRDSQDEASDNSKTLKQNDAKVRKSPRKNKNTQLHEEGKGGKGHKSKNTQLNGEEKGGKGHKRKQIWSEDEESDINIDESTDEQEDVITSRRPYKKAKSKQSKKANRALDSDSEEDPLPKEKPAVKRRRKKEAVVFIDESDGEKRETALDKFIIHNPSPQLQADKKNTSKKEEVTKGKPVSVMDFFGGGTVTRSDRVTAVEKRKHEGLDKSAEIDVTFDEEEHDDDAFLKTLDQLDGPAVKKVKQSEECQGKTQPAEVNTGSLASKLVNKMKQSSQGSPDINGNATKVDTSPARKNTKSPVNVVSPSKSPKKGRVYTMEVTKTKPVSPAKSNNDDVKETTPAKKTAAATPPEKGSSSKKKDAAWTNNDDGFGSKVIGGFRAFKARSGPQALGSRDLPQGAENCLEGMTFVITGVLDTMERDDAKTVIERHGGKVTGNISRKTNYVVVGREAGESKLSKARDMKVKQLSEDELYELITTQPGKTSKYETQAKEQLKKETTQKKAEEEKKATAAAHRLQAFRSEKDMKNSQVSSASLPKKESLFTQIKDSSASAAKVPSTTASRLSTQSETPSENQSVKTENQSESLMWVDKHKPTNIKQIIGQQGDKSNAKKLLHWLQCWHENVLVKRLKPSGNFFGRGDGAGCRAALLSGPPGIGKTTTATLVCQEAAFSYVELNASDTRSKRSLKEVVSESLNNQTLVDYMGDHAGPPSGQTHCLVMDEVDGMAGNEDRGGLQELIQLIKTTKIPIICICNDRNSMKMRTLSNYCLDLRFQRPRVEQIKGAMMSMAFREGVKIPPAALNEIISASNHDIRQIVHNLSMWSAGSKTLTFEQVKKDAQKAQKDIKLGPFDVCRKVFVNDEETRKMSLNDKSDLFFHDYSFGPLFVHENYLHIIPTKAQGKQTRHMQCLSQTIDSICDGDLVDRAIRKDGNWNLLPSQAMYSSVIPGEIMRGSFPQMPDFPQWLGKFSTTNKTHRILQELGTHMRLQISSDKRGLALDYLPALRSRLTIPLMSKGADGVPEVIQVMDDYDIIKEDFDNILEVTKWPNSLDPMSKLDTKTKAAFTRQYNKEIHMTPYATGVLSKKRRGKAAPIDETGLSLEEGEGEEGVAPGGDSEEEEGGIEADTMIKAKKPSTSSKSKTGSHQPGTSRNGSQKSETSRSKGKGGNASGKGKR